MMKVQSVSTRLLTRSSVLAALSALIMTDGVVGQSIPTGSVTARLRTVTTVNTTQTGSPSYLTHTGDGSGRVYVVGQGGQIVGIENGVIQPTPFLDIPGLPEASAIRFLNGGERGLLGLAFHPNYASAGDVPGSGKVYTYTSERGTSATGTTFTPDFNHPELGLVADHHTVIREWTVSPEAPGQVDTTIPSRELMRINQPQSNHNGGALGFDTNGLLYISLGDGGGGNDNQGGINHPSDGHTNGTGNSQDNSNVYGTILRIDPLGATGDLGSNGQYSIPTDNEFVNDPSGVDEIYAYGLRNPFRMSFDRDTGELYVGDVGQSANEEINVIEAGGNHGWVYWEGTRPNREGGPAFEDTVAPIGEYDNNTDGRAVIGGFVYRGSRVPQLQDKYIFGDLSGSGFTTGRVFYMDLPENPGDPGDPYGAIQEFMIHPDGEPITGRLHGFGEDEDGELYMLMSNGRVIKFMPHPGDVDGNGFTDFFDFLTLQNHFEQPGDFSDGDFNEDGVVDFFDFLILQNSFETGDQAELLAPTRSANTIPVPGSGVMLIVGAMGVLRRRSRGKA